MPTADNLKNAFAGESQANRKYLAFAQKAESEGHPNIARLFRAAAAAETVHAHAHLRAMGGIQSTAENLGAAIEGEGFEFQEMYPKFIAEAKDEANTPARVSFENALMVEEIHHGLYSEALQAIEGGQDLPAAEMFVCGVCGNTGWGAAPEKCPLCGAPNAKFFKVE